MEQRERQRRPACWFGGPSLNHSTRVRGPIQRGLAAAAAELQRNAIAAIVNVLAAHRRAVHITLSLPCGEQRTQNRRREPLENRTGRLGRAIHVIRAGRRLQND